MPESRNPGADAGKQELTRAPMQGQWLMRMQGQMLGKLVRAPMKDLMQKQERKLTLEQMRDGC